MNLTDYHAKYFAHELTKRCPSDSVDKLASAVAGAQVDLNPHQVDAALFAFRSPLSKGALLADEVGLISKEFNAAMLAEAVCKLEGFKYVPSDSIYWQHGHSTEQDFIYVTTQHLSPEQLAQLSDEVGTGRTLLVLCAAFRAGTRDVTERYPNLTIKKIPKQVLARCEWGHDDYSLKVENLPKAPVPPPKAGQMDLI